MWRGTDINSAPVNQQALRKRQVFGKHGRRVKKSVTVMIDQSQDAVFWVLELHRSLVRISRTVGHVERPVGIETHVYGTPHQRWSGHAFQLKTFSNREFVRFEYNRFSIDRHIGDDAHAN